MMRSIGELCRDVIDAMGIEAAAVERAEEMGKRHGGAEGVTLHAVPVLPSEGGRSGFGTNAKRQEEETCIWTSNGKHMLTVLPGGQVHRHSEPHEARPASAMAIHLITVDGVRVGHASTPAGLSR